MGVYLAKENEEGHSVVPFISGRFSSDLIEHVAERKMRIISPGATVV